MLRLYDFLPSGNGYKVRLLLQAFDAPARYLPIDISGEHLRDAAAMLRAEFHGLDGRPVARARASSVLSTS